MSELSTFLGKNDCICVAICQYCEVNLQPTTFVSERRRRGKAALWENVIHFCKSSSRLSVAKPLHVSHFERMLQLQSVSAAGSKALGERNRSQCGSLFILQFCLSKERSQDDGSVGTGGRVSGLLCMVINVLPCEWRGGGGRVNKHTGDHYNWSEHWRACWIRNIKLYKHR